MFSFPVIFWLLFLFLNVSNAENDALDSDVYPDTPLDQRIDMSTILENSIVELEGLGSTARDAKLYDPTDDIAKTSKRMINILREVKELVKTRNNAYKFVKLKGIDRVIQQYMRLDNSELKAYLLSLTKMLFETAPMTTTASVPITLVDQLLDIFENGNLALKAHALDILALWLPNNPRVQARVMKIKGLTPFYDQIAKLDTSVVKTLLDLFNKILQEHIIARSDDQKTFMDAEKLKFYQRIGLLEQMETATVCNGLLNIFGTSWTYNTIDNNILITVFDTMKNSIRFCWRIFAKNPKALKLFAALQDYVKEPQNKEYFEANNVSVEDLVALIDEYVDKISYPKKEEL